MKKIIVLSVVSFIFFLLIKAPASLLVPYINKNPYFQVQSIMGSIFSGKMQTTGKIDGLIYQFNPWSLLLADLSFDIQAKKDNSLLKGEVGVNLITQKIEVEQLIGTLNLALFQHYIPVLSTVDPKGNLFFNGLNIVWDDIKNNQVPQYLSGNIELLKLQALGENFGNYQFNVDTQDSNIVGTLNNKKSAATNTKIKLNLSNAKKQLGISGTITGNSANAKEILKQLNMTNIKKTIRY